MKKIQTLPQDVIAKIAAGEVIERPAYAVKELVENSLDAHADSVSIHIEESGLRRIIVIDNGIGMSREDLSECFKLHTTSKLTSIDQLSHIATLGFRGEALASIAAISNMLIRSRQKKSVAGTQVELENGKLKQIVPVGMPVGTNVTVANLFHNVPGRKKFLKSPQTEFRHIVQLVSTLALAHPEVHFHLTHNKKTVFDLPQSIITDSSTVIPAKAGIQKGLDPRVKPEDDNLQHLAERIKILLGSKVFASLLPITYTNKFLIVSGFIAKPQESSFTSSKQFLFLNGRSITDKVLARMVKDAYGTLLAGSKHPIFVLSLSLPYEHVDVNIHPRKEQVRFTDAQFLYDEMHVSVSRTLAENNLTFYDAEGTGFTLGDADITSSFAGQILKEKRLPWDIRILAEESPNEILQIHNVYLLRQTKFGLLLVDQHAAHERILYEQFLEMFQKEQTVTPQYHLPKPVALELSVTEKELLQEHSQILKNIGIDIEQFQGNSFLVNAVPLIFQDRKPDELIMEMFADLEKTGKAKSVDVVSKKLVAYLACRGAVKAGESLSKKQAQELLEKLEKTNNNATCPHGRPTKIIIDIDQLHRMFKRK